MSPQLSLLIPVYNEREWLPEVVEAIEAGLQTLEPLDVETIWIDDASTDGSGSWLTETLPGLPGVHRLIRLTTNGGKGRAIQAGLQVARGRWVLLHDADLEYNPQDWPAVLAPLTQGQSRVVYGSRFQLANHQAGFQPLYYWGNRFLTTCFNALHGTRLTDMETGMKAFERVLLEGVTLSARGFELEPELSAYLSRRAGAIREVPIGYQARSRAQGKKIRPRDGWIALAMMVKSRFRLNQ